MPSRVRFESLRMSYRPEIDGLRAVAVLAVIAHHAGAPLEGGFLGVDIFFVISGYLITGILLTDMHTGRFSIGRFYLRRARRILPALMIVVATSVPLAWILMTPDQLKLFGQALVAISVFGSNGLYWWKTDYFAPAASENPLIHTWSLGVEEQFYLIFPLVLLWLWRRDRVGLGLGVALIIGLAAAEAAARFAPAAAFYLLPFRAWELLAGAVAAALVMRFGLPARGPCIGAGSFGLWATLARWRGVLSFAGVCLVVASLLMYHARLPIPGLWLLAPVGGTVLVIVFGGPGTLAYWLLASRPAVALGLISYAAYLWHQPVFAFARLAQLDPPGPLQMAGLTVLVMALAWATWAFVEKPLRHGLSMRPLVLTSAVGAAVAVVVGLSLFLGGGFGSLRFGPDKAALFASAEVSSARDTCHGNPDRLAPETACVLGGATPMWAVLGDSHGVELAYALAEKVRRQAPMRGQGVVQLTASGCPPALGFGTPVPGCATWTEAAVSWLEDHPEVAVLIGFRHNAYLFGKNEGLFPDLPDAPYKIDVPGTAAEKRGRYWSAFESLVARLQEGGRRVVVLMPVPELSRSAEKLLVFTGNSASGDLAGVPRGYHAMRNAWINERFARSQMETLDPSVSLCDTSRCYVVRNGRALYFDDNHLSLAGAESVVDLLDVQRTQTHADRSVSAEPPSQNTKTVAQTVQP